jgi:hypothetical protein
MEEPIKGTPIYESNPPESEDNPRYVVSRQIGIIPPEPVEESPPEEIPRYIAGGSGGSDNESSKRVDSNATEPTVAEHLHE